MGMADIAQVLWGDFMKHNPGNPLWVDRDRFVLSNGHASMLLYSLLYLTGYPLGLEEIKNFRQLGSRCAGHPEHEPAVGIETTTGPLGQGHEGGEDDALLDADQGDDQRRDPGQACPVGELGERDRTDGREGDLAKRDLTRCPRQQTQRKQEDDVRQRRCPPRQSESGPCRDSEQEGGDNDCPHQLHTIRGAGYVLRA